MSRHRAGNLKNENVKRARAMTLHKNWGTLTVGCRLSGPFHVTSPATAEIPACNVAIIVRQSPERARSGIQLTSLGISASLHGSCFNPSSQCALCCALRIARNLARAFHLNQVLSLIRRLDIIPKEVNSCSLCQSTLNCPLLDCKIMVSKI